MGYTIFEEYQSSVSGVSYTEYLERQVAALRQDLRRAEHGAHLSFMMLDKSEQQNRSVMTLLKCVRNYIAAGQFEYVKKLLSEEE